MMKLAIVVIASAAMVGCCASSDQAHHNLFSPERHAWELRHQYDVNCPKLDECYWYPDYKTKTALGAVRSKWMTDIQWGNYQKIEWPTLQNIVHTELEETGDGTEVVITVTDVDGKKASFWVKNGCKAGLGRDNTCGGDVRDISPY